MSENKNWWEWEVNSKPQKLGTSFKEVFAYKHLLFSLIRREFLLNYQQTVLGPLWVLFQPILTLITYLFVFGKVFKVPIGSDAPPVLFYFSGIVLWNFFNDVFNNTSRTFRDNINLFSKVYFPRIIIPLAIIGTQFFRFVIQFILLMLLLFYFVFAKDYTVAIKPFIFYLPLAVVLTVVLGMSLGLIFAFVTAKYRDLANLVDIFIRLLVFFTPVFYSLRSVRPDIHWVVDLNPLTPLFEMFRLGIIGSGTITAFQIVYSLTFITLMFLASWTLFNRKATIVIDIV